MERSLLAISRAPDVRCFEGCWCCKFPRVLHDVSSGFDVFLLLVLGFDGFCFKTRGLPKDCNQDCPSLPVASGNVGHLEFGHALSCFVHSRFKNHQKASS